MQQTTTAIAKEIHTLQRWQAKGQLLHPCTIVERGKTKTYVIQ